MRLKIFSESRQRRILVSSVLIVAVLGSLSGLYLASGTSHLPSAVASASVVSPSTKTNQLVGGADRGAYNGCVFQTAKCQ